MENSTNDFLLLVFIAHKNLVEQSRSLKTIIKEHKKTIPTKQSKSSTMAPRRSTRIRAAAATNKPVAVPAPKKAATKKRAPKRTKKSSASDAAITKKMKTGLQSSVDTTNVLGVVDPESDINGTINILDNDPCDCMLVQVDPSQNMDRFYVLQLIVCDEEEDVSEPFVVYSRWGRTGSTGQGLTQEFDDHDKAIKCFEKKFKDKTGLKWENRSSTPVENKYRVIQQNYVEKRGGYTSAKWQYWVDDGIDGKQDGWYDYDESGSRNVEQLYQEKSHNTNLTNRLVDSGCWTYQVDLIAMTQTNVKHPARKSRFIRRFTGVERNEAPFTTFNLATLATPSMVTPTITPVKSAKVMPPKTSSAVTSLAAKVEAASSSEIQPPVDTDIDRYGSAPHSSTLSVMKNEDDKWYDVVLNQCNITGGNNNNKYYRIQMLKKESTDQIYVWFKWGRVGETPRQNGMKLEGPFSQEAPALKVFAKKYKDKTKNNWGDEEFVVHKGKYTRIEIDYGVDANGMKPANNSNNVKEEYEYMDSKLDPKTKELIEVLFSKDMRDNALTSFNLDLKRLPLGVPSQQQVQNGVSVLNKIENKLIGGRVSDSYNSLSSQFYTAIPHSFGRMRPPTINTQSSLQERYDMCNILLDMFSTNETIRQLEEDKPKKKLIPCPVDSQYDTLKADLSLIDNKSDEFKMIQNYFNKTKSNGSRANLIDAWCVDRQGESDRYKKFEEMDNRRLLWHGTNIAVVAPIITSGLRIMPHSGGRVGAGIYLASMQEKSQQYTSGYGSKFACMFLCEGALGKTHSVTSDGSHASSLKKAPKGYDSVHAVGQVTPKSWTETKIEEKDVTVPKDKAHDSGVQSSFYHDEFLVYDEAQVRLRYVLTVKLH